MQHISTGSRYTSPFAPGRNHSRISLSFTFRKPVLPSCGNTMPLLPSAKRYRRITYRRPERILPRLLLRGLDKSRTLRPATEMQTIKMGDDCQEKQRVRPSAPLSEVAARTKPPAAGECPLASGDTLV